MTGCPNGWLAWEGALTGYSPTLVYYYAPAAAGGYQVVAQGEITPQSGKQYKGSATANVTVTSP